MNETKQEIDGFLKQQSKRFFSYLISPESYLLVAGLLSGMVAIPLLILNAIALNCLATNCPDLQNGSNTLGSWLVFEGLVLFFVGMSAGAIWKFRQISKEQKSC